MLFTLFLTYRMFPTYIYTHTHMYFNHLWLLCALIPRSTLKEFYDGFIGSM